MNPHCRYFWGKKEVQPRTSEFAGHTFTTANAFKCFQHLSTSLWDTVRESQRRQRYKSKRLASPCHPRSRPAHLEVCSGTLDAETPESSPPVGRGVDPMGCTGRGLMDSTSSWNSTMWYDVQLLILLLVTVWLNNPQFRIFIAIALLWY
jgi:hypothetical protein